ncbi:carboxypeptidase-like regulatory domain-containing protein [Hymenobacter sp. HDW8]|uniref:carboxypeptidase-like regulatory domain-containing protein n=1 Tax=Hymenobacter sp. HDW8 TaxID=2714932 RepID=UPI0014098F67|nr:carboxypeptidase-like regulatory domain-containing protein [Hymenobacter sp. HDW8]QIL74450.1 carboxypeptidase-like regulatory domain-containing protein [Hymenobacter sp. HDW8]
MMLLITLKALNRPMLALLIVVGCLISNFAHANDPTAKDKKGKVIAPAVNEVASVSGTAATVVLTGRIRNEEGQPLAGATVYLHGSAVAVTTDEQGLFSLEVPAAGKKTLRYGYGGYQDRDVIVSSSAP